MKMQIISLLIILSIGVACTMNYRRVTSATEELLSSLEAIDGEEDTDGYERFAELWETHRDYFLLTVPTSRIDPADAAVLRLGASVRSESSIDYTKEKALVKRAIEDIGQYSALSLKNIL